jgi:hypothetical protein
MQNSSVTNSVIAFTSSHAVVVMNGANATAVNNIITYSGGSAFYPNGRTTYYDARQNDMWKNVNNNQGDFPGGNGNLFVDPAVYPVTYKLFPTSPLVGAGSGGIDIGAYGKTDFQLPTAPWIDRASRIWPTVDLDWVNSTDNVGLSYYFMYQADSSAGPWKFHHSCLASPAMDPFCLAMRVPTPYITPTPMPTPIAGFTPLPVLPWWKMAAIDTSFNRGPDSSAGSSPTYPIQLDFENRYCPPHSAMGKVILNWNRSIPQVGGAIDAYEIDLCSYEDGTSCTACNSQSTTCYPVAVSGTPTGDFRVGFEYRWCDFLWHYFRIRGEEKAGPVGNERYSWSLWSNMKKVCNTYPDTLCMTPTPLPTSAPPGPNGPELAPADDGMPSDLPVLRLRN